MIQYKAYIGPGTNESIGKIRQSSSPKDAVEAVIEDFKKGKEYDEHTDTSES
jgi:hypothetical protein